MNWLDKLKKAGEEATKGPWQWLSYDLVVDETGRQWRWKTPDGGLYDETMLTTAKPGDLYIQKVGDGVILSAQSCGYGGEVDISIGDADKGFIAISRNCWDELVVVVDAVKSPLFSSEDHKDWRRLQDALDALKAKVKGL